MNEEKLANSPPTLPKPRIWNAVYGISSMQRYRNNILIEALPDYLTYTAQSIQEGLEKRPEGLAGPASRRQRASWLMSAPSKLFAAEGRHLELAEIIDLMIREGYVYRNPNYPTDPVYLTEAYRRQQEGEKIVVKYDEGWPEPMTAAVIGCSGTGKSFAVKEILKLYPHVIRHRWPLSEEGNGDRYETFDQIVYLIVECPPDGSVKTMCKNILEEVDRVTGLDYFKVYRVHRATEADLRRAVVQVMALHRVGLLVIDEMQNIVLSRKNHEELFNFVVTLANSVEVPLLHVATPRVWDFLEDNLRVARRFGTKGTYNWTRLKFGDTEWQSFFRKLKSVYVLKLPFDDEEIAHSLFEHSQGIAGILVNLFILAQMQAMVLSQEKLTSPIIKWTAATYFAHVFPMVDAIRKGTAEALKGFPDLPFTPANFAEAADELRRSLDAVVNQQDEMEYLQRQASQKLKMLAQKTDNPALEDVSKVALNASKDNP